MTAVSRASEKDPSEWHGRTMLPFVAYPLYHPSSCAPCSAYWAAATIKLHWQRSLTIIITLTIMWLLLYSTPFRHSSHLPFGQRRKVRYPDLYEASLAELQFGLTHEHFTSAELTKVVITSAWAALLLEYSLELRPGVYRAH